MSYSSAIPARSTVVRADRMVQGDRMWIPDGPPLVLRHVPVRQDDGRLKLFFEVHPMFGLVTPSIVRPDDVFTVLTGLTTPRP